MSNDVNTTFIDYFAEFKNVPKQWEEAQNFLNYYLTITTNFLNSKEIGIYSNQVTPSGKQIYIGSTSYDVLRKTVVFGALPNDETKPIAHGLSVDSSFRIVEMYLSANDTQNLKYFCLEYFSIASSDIVLDMNETDVIVTTQSNYSSYDKCLVYIDFVTGVS